MEFDDNLQICCQKDHFLKTNKQTFQVTYYDNGNYWSSGTTDSTRLEIGQFSAQNVMHSNYLRHLSVKGC